MGINDLDDDWDSTANEEYEDFDDHTEDLEDESELEADEVPLDDTPAPLENDSTNTELPHLVDQLAIPLVFEVGTSEVTVAQLREIDAGYTFELNTPIVNAVSVKAYGQKLCMGTLVNIDGRIGVQLTTGPNHGNA
ncbi:FliM/FliN family flagellar motor switch protein [Bremerella sp. JC770]|uniref:FliM/FliN family flagellar motor switch protein n=1 Tax=Bremerella sp. JC770 TaxID=3232137 RepID=UPI003458C839